jgi:DHA3 family macrolide efflux protein-like MFS transporter
MITLMNKKPPWKKAIALFLASQNISLFGSALVQYAITWYITLQTQSGLMMTIAIICGFVPTFFISPFAGVWADRYDRKTLIMVSDALIAAATLALAILFINGYGSIGLLFGVSVIRSFGAGIQIPAVGAILPDIVPEDMLTKVNGINSSVQSLVTLLSPLLSGALLTLASIEVIFFIDVITATAAIVILLLWLKIPTHNRALDKTKIGYFSDMSAGLRYINSHGFIKTLFLFCGIYFVLVAPLAFLTPLQVTRSFGADVWRLTAIEVAFSVGMMAGGLLIAVWGGFKNRVHTMAFSSLVVAVCTFALGSVPIFWLYLFFMALVGVVMPVFNTPFVVMLQQKVETDYLGRVFGVLNMISSSVMPLAMVLFGPAADLIRIEWLLLGTGVLMLVEGFFMLFNRVLVEAGRPEPETGE